MEALMRRLIGWNNVRPGIGAAGNAAAEVHCL